MTPEEKPCILYPERPACIGCGDCRCELDPEKICDNCMRCVEEGAEFRSVLISGVVMDQSEADPPAQGDEGGQEDPLRG